MRLARFLATAVIALVAGQASAQEHAAYPTRPITLIVAFGPGGPSDTTGRLVESVSGADSTIGSACVARSAPDGYTPLLNHLALPGGAALYASLPSDTATTSAPIGLINYGPLVLMGRRDLPPPPTPPR